VIWDCPFDSLPETSYSKKTCGEKHVVKTYGKNNCKSKGFTDKASSDLSESHSPWYYSIDDGCPNPEAVSSRPAHGRMGFLGKRHDSIRVLPASAARRLYM
jgi:hypothetical protein